MDVPLSAEMGGGGTLREDGTQQQWLGRAALREKGHTKGRRPSGGGMRAAWYKQRARLMAEGHTSDQAEQILGPRPP